MAVYNYVISGELLINRLTAKQTNSYNSVIRNLRSEEEKRPKKVAKLVHSAAEKLPLCCKKLSCTANFSATEVLEVRSHYAELGERERYTVHLPVTLLTAIRRQHLITLLSSCLRKSSPFQRNWKIEYAIRGVRVCRKGFGLIIGASDTKIDAALKAVFAESSVDTPHKNELRQYTSPVTAAITVWLQELLGVFVDKQPDKDEWHCPIAVNRRHLWGMFCEENARLDVKRDPFYKVLQNDWDWVKFPKHTRLGKCDTCVEIQQELTDKRHSSTAEVNSVRSRQKVHLNLMQGERTQYDGRKTMPASRVWQNIWDGYSGILLPHKCWATMPKSWLRLARLRLHVSGLINHNLGVRTLFVSISEQFAHDSNYSINILACHLHQALAVDKKEPPPVMFFQSDNCWRENKNIFVFGFFATLLLKRWTKVIYFGNLPQGHTHTDIDQLCVPLVKALKTYNLLNGNPDTVTQLVRSAYEKPPTVKHFNNIKDYRSWLAPYLPTLEGHSVPHLFRFTLNEDGAVEMTWRDYSVTGNNELYQNQLITNQLDENWKGDQNGDPIIILHQLPPNLPEDILPAPIDNKHCIAVKKTYDLLDADSKLYFNNLFDGQVAEVSEEATWVLQNTGPYTDNLYEELSFAPPQNQIKWHSTTSLTVSRQAKSRVAPVVEINNTDLDAPPSSESDEQELLVAEQLDEDYDAPILMQPTPREWISKEYRLTQGELDRTTRRKNQPNYANVNAGKTNNNN